MSKPILLCVDDVPQLLEAYKRGLGDTFNVLTASTPEQATILAPRADVILSDWRLEKCTAKEFLMLFPNKPTVVLSGTPHEVRLDHAWLILAKPTEMARVKSALQEALGVDHDTWSRESSNEDQRRAATPDARAREAEQDLECTG